MFMKNNKNTTGVHQISGFPRLSTVQTADGGGAAATVEVSDGGAGRKLARFAAVVVHGVGRGRMSRFVSDNDKWSAKKANYSKFAV
ncbi:hypothetical protein P8452_28896 [Trifolium repens]|nr:hypothetical protein P8452_28896 [Trifolium repens]